MPDMREQIRQELHSCHKRGLKPPATPDPAALWDACDGDGCLALMVALEFYAARRAFREEQAQEWRERLPASRYAA